ncbi:MAG: ArsR/SmtB family transcription factor [Prosthecobacter sp.]|uniref:ArsR/SmtB family transcription factor n=1 Tax=Prosthecobacter sp. TaxID=1965333 RepID=UPI003900DC5D
MSQPAATTAPPPAKPDPVRLLWALGDAVRLGIVRELAAGQALNVQMLAARLRRDPDLISKHLRVLRDCGAIQRVRPPETDGRQQFHQLPENSWHPLPEGGAAVDWGVALLRFPAAQG